ncbi:MAG TPA: GFA family protein [Croceibacterium sp.]|nr:GFA family protein [Croceibacterium sp.]
MSRAGQCNCGAVRARVAGEPVAVRQCWCRQCQKLAGGGATHNAMFRTEDVELSGPLASWSYVADSGNTLTMHSCAECGTPVYAQSSARPQYRTIRIGFLDEPHGLAPTTAIWTDEKPAWAALDPKLESLPRQAPAPAPK